MKKIKGEHPRDPGTTITIKPYYPYKVSRQRFGAKSEWEVIGSHDDACIRVTSTQGLVKGQRASLAIPRDEDPEVGGFWDCDGTRSREFVEMQVAESVHFEYGFIVEGFVRLGDWYNNDSESWKFAYERWDQYLRKGAH